MSIPPSRLRDTDSRLAHLFDALERRGPDPSLVAKVLAIPDAAPLAVSPDPALPRSMPSVGRWLVAGACALTLAGLGWSVADYTRPSASAPPAPAALPAADAPAPSVVQNAGAPTVSVDDLPEAPEQPVRLQPAASVSTKPAATTTQSAGSTFHEELALVEAARSALARGDSRGCLDTLDRYDERFRGGVLASEADITRIEALAKSGRVDEARVLADRFLTRHATSPYADRVRALRAKLGDDSKEIER